MARDKNDVYIGKPYYGDDNATGFIQIGTLSATKPTDARTKLTIEMGWTESIGYIASDGVVISGLMAEGDTIPDMGGEIVRVLDGDAKPTIKIPSMQIDDVAAKLIAGEENVTKTAATADKGKQIEISFNGKVGEPHGLTLNMKDGNRRMRIYVPSAQATSLEDITLSNKSTINLSATFALNADAAGKYIYFIFDNGQVKAD